jgi:hypothetical protein
MKTCQYNSKTDLFREIIPFGTNQIQMQGVRPSSQALMSMYV